MIKVKICGITNLEDARVAIAAGADYLGFICYPPSPRYLQPDRITEILSQIHDPVTTVGVFVNEHIESVQQILDQTGLDLAQLHGEESSTFMRHYQGRAFKALRPKSLEEAKDQALHFAPLGPAFGPDLLIDAYHVHAYGGTGRRADWDVAAILASSYRILLAGGLDTGNVTGAVREVKPWGVDVSSGVEYQPGKKDPDAVQAFIAAAHKASG